ncbi:hypothetical protein Pint_27182 [Pistacia integerrima]|uniref:Uncharacterized protein n=1 Tax=Pistacia integerrima TaxID=434235 RepID=A0ACC0YPC1_9ROSI|nr:hypothetical protein Pint_27182 [Pistacia integerrima]
MFLCFLIVVSSFLVYGFCITRYRKLPENSDLGLTQEFTVQSFTYNELEDATDGFKEELERSCFEAVYKGTLREGNKMIAVKRFDSNPMEEGRKFRQEMAAVCQTHHRHLVRLLGFCVENSKKILVYEYLNKELNKLITEKEGQVDMKALERMVKVGLLCI